MLQSRERPTRVRQRAALLWRAAGARLSPDDAFGDGAAHVAKPAADGAEHFVHDRSRPPELAPARGDAGPSGAREARGALCTAHGAHGLVPEGHYVI